MNGKGIYHYLDGRVYDGEFVEDLKSGFGIMTWYVKNSL